MELDHPMSFVDLLSSFVEPLPQLPSAPASVQFPLPFNDDFETINGFSEHSNSDYSDESLSIVGEDSDDGLEENEVEGANIRIRPFSERLKIFMSDVGDDNSHEIPTLKKTKNIDFWNESQNQIRLGMRFESKSLLKKAVTLWSISQNREFRVVESRINTWAAKCKTIEQESSSGHYAPLCMWYVRAIQKKSHQQWQITRWVSEHNCFGATNGNNNRNLTSTIIASYIRHSIEVDPSYPVKNIQVDIKNSLNVDINYKKAWHGRRKAIEDVHGDWESNFVELPAYIAALEASNPNTIVKWLHHPNSSTNTMTFKYVFWAFGPAIDAFHMCRPVISVDGTHLRGAYKGKMLVVVSKDANNRILPVAYAIVDEETNDSWCWFFEQFRYYVAQDKQLCVISDRHKGIIHAMSTLENWKEPFAYHRFCLRHIRSNLMSKYKGISLKRLCWVIGSTTQKRKFAKYKKEMKTLNPNAWQYLQGIDRSQWCIAFDKNRRWGCLTTNISESFNNVLRGARQLPIRACIELTFYRTVQLFQKYNALALNCNTPLPPNIWRIFKNVDAHAQRHQIQEFDYTNGLYKIITGRKQDGSGGNVQTVHYYQHKCTCGKWQTHRFPCSHAILACRHRGDDPSLLINEVYTTATFRHQYVSDFVPLPHVEYWVDPGWKIQADYTRIVASRGRRRESRFHNEMDIRYPDEPRRCGMCHQTGHDRRNCSNSQPRFTD